MLVLLRQHTRAAHLHRACGPGSLSVVYFLLQAAKEQLGSSSLKRPMDDILPGAEDTETIENYIDVRPTTVPLPPCSCAGGH